MGNPSIALDAKGNVRPALLPYIRVSTDDKGQDPKRQLSSIAIWADREGYILLAPEEDEGTSASKVAALDREYFLRACERATAAGAEGIIMELPDRFSRMDPMYAVWEMVEVRNRYGLEIYFAGVPLAFQTSNWGKLMVFMQMGAAHQWVVDHTARVISGMDRKRAQGVKFGRKPKTLTADEIDLVKHWRSSENLGWETIAININEMREVHRMTDKATAYERMVSSGSLRRMAKEGIFGKQDETKEGQNMDTVDESISSPSEDQTRLAEVVSSGSDAE